MSHNLLKMIGLLFLFISIQAFAQTTEKEAQAIDTFMQSFIQAYENRNLAALATFYHPNAVVIGTGKDEVVIGRNAIMVGFARDLSQHTDATISIQRIAVDIRGNTAFASYYCTVSVQIPNREPFQSKLRFTLGLVKYHDQWVVLQSHLSAPLAGEEDRQAFPKA